MKYPVLSDGDWIRPVRKGFKLGCCDCGLVHTVNFKVVKGVLHMQMTRNKRATAQKRRHRDN